MFKVIQESRDEGADGHVQYVSIHNADKHTVQGLRELPAVLEILSFMDLLKISI